MPDIDLFSVVTLLADQPRLGLVRGQVGTVVEELAPGVFEVEFLDEAGQTQAMASLTSGELAPSNEGR